MTIYSPKQIKSAIKGPVFPILTPFRKNGDAVDYKALQNYVEFLINKEASTILVTVGTSRFNLLTREEMRMVNQTVVKAVKGNAVAIAATPISASLQENIEFARHAQEVGADAVIIMYPERYYGDEEIFDFYRAITESVDIGVLIHEMPMRSGYDGTPVQYSIELLERLTNLPGIAGFKEECGNGEYAYQILRRLSEKTAVIGAGSMRRFMRDFHAGANAYLVGIGSFLPKLAQQFYDEMIDGNFKQAHQIVRDNEDPYFDLAVSLGWHLSLKATLAIIQLMPIEERLPLKPLDLEEQKKLKQVIIKCGWLNGGIL